MHPLKLCFQSSDDLCPVWSQKAAFIRFPQDCQTLHKTKPITWGKTLSNSSWNTINLMLMMVWTLVGSVDYGTPEYKFVEKRRPTAKSFPVVGYATAPPLQDARVWSRVCSLLWPTHIASWSHRSKSQVRFSSNLPRVLTPSYVCFFSEQQSNETELSPVSSVNTQLTWCFGAGLPTFSSQMNTYFKGFVCDNQVQFERIGNAQGMI